MSGSLRRPLVAGTSRATCEGQFVGHFAPWPVVGHFVGHFCGSHAVLVWVTVVPEARWRIFLVINILKGIPFPGPSPASFCLLSPFSLSPCSVHPLLSAWYDEV